MFCSIEKSGRFLYFLFNIFYETRNSLFVVIFLIVSSVLSEPQPGKQMSFFLTLDFSDQAQARVVLVLVSGAGERKEGEGRRRFIESLTDKFILSPVERLGKCYRRTNIYIYLYLL